jgi:hypothetical protein
MKATPSTRASLLFIAFAGLLAASQPALAAAPKADARATALVAALQAVSPDPLGGRLGLAATAARPSAPANGAMGGHLAAEASHLDRDQRAYLVWKSAQKS